MHFCTFSLKKKNIWPSIKYIFLLLLLAFLVKLALGFCFYILYTRFLKKRKTFLRVLRQANQDL